MPIDYHTALAVAGDNIPASYSRTDAILYALGVGFCRDPLDKQELSFVYEKRLVVSPTFSVNLAFAGQDLTADIGINLLMLVHGEQRIEFHRPMPPAADTLIATRVVDIYDKGEGKGAVVIVESKARLKETDEPLVTLTSSLFARGDGGFMKPGETSKTLQPKSHPIPDRAPDHIDAFETRADQALLYRLSGDFNPLHVDPAFAAKAGFPQPILHGLCSYGICAKAILKTVLDYDTARMRGFQARFTNPVIPGETLLTDIWVDGDQISFRARIKERDVVAINNGLCLVAEKAS